MSHFSGPAALGGSDAVAVAPGAWLRNRRRTQTWAAVCVVWSLVFAGLVLIPGRLPAHGPAGAIAGLIVFYVGIGALGLVLARRVARAGLWIGPEAIVIRGPFRTRSIALADAGWFAPGLQGRGGNGVPCPMLARRDGGAGAGVWALGQRNVWFRWARISGELHPLCDELNTLVADLRRGS